MELTWRSCLKLILVQFTIFSQTKQLSCQLSFPRKPSCLSCTLKSKERSKTKILSHPSNLWSCIVDSEGLPANQSTLRRQIQAQPQRNSSLCDFCTKNSQLLQRFTVQSYSHLAKYYSSHNNLSSHSRAMQLLLLVLLCLQIPWESF